MGEYEYGLPARKIQPTLFIFVHLFEAPNGASEVQFFRASEVFTLYHRR